MRAALGRVIPVLPWLGTGRARTAPLTVLSDSRALARAADLHPSLRRPPVPPSVLSKGLGYLGRFVGPVGAFIGLSIPSELGEFNPLSLRGAELRWKTAQTQPRIQRLLGAMRGTQGPIRYDQDRDFFRQPLGAESGEFGPSPDILAPLGPTPFGQRVLDTVGDFGREWLDRELGKYDLERTPPPPRAEPASPLYEYTGPQGPPEPAARAPGVASSASSAPAKRKGFQRPALRYAAIGLGTLVTRSLIRGGAPAAYPTSPGGAIGTLPLPSVSPLPTTTGLTPFNTPGVSFFPQLGGGGASARCDCKPKKRGPQRKCLERGAVAWKSGRYKGRSAGQKCIRFAT